MVAPKRAREFDVRSFLESGGVEKETIEFPSNAVIYQQGDPAEATYLQKGGDCQTRNVEAPRGAAGLSSLFIAYMLTRNISIEEGFVEQLFNSSEKRLARILLLLARYGKKEVAQRIIPNVSQEVLAEMVGTTRSHVNFFMNKFRKLGFIEYNGDLKIHDSLMSVVLHD